VKKGKGRNRRKVGKGNLKRVVIQHDSLHIRGSSRNSYEVPVGVRELVEVQHHKKERGLTKTGRAVLGRGEMRRGGDCRGRRKGTGKPPREVLHSSPGRKLA